MGQQSRWVHLFTDTHVGNATPFSIFFPLKTFCVALHIVMVSMFVCTQTSAHRGWGQGPYCSMPSSPAEQTSTILTPAVHFLITSASTPVPVYVHVSIAEKRIIGRKHARAARTVGDVRGGFVFCDDV